MLYDFYIFPIYTACPTRLFLDLITSEIQLDEKVDKFYNKNIPLHHASN